MIHDQARDRLVNLGQRDVVQVEIAPYKFHVVQLQIVFLSSQHPRSEPFFRYSTKNKILTIYQLRRTVRALHIQFEKHIFSKIKIKMTCLFHTQVSF